MIKKPLLIKGQMEAELLKLGFSILGVDEVGRGCWAGPVCAGAVSLDYHRVLALDPHLLGLIRDSKKLSSAQRQKVIPLIESVAQGIGIGWSSVEEVESLGLQKSIFVAMQRAIAASGMRPGMVLVDGNLKIPNLEYAQQTVVKGDSLCFAIAAASILAKEARDGWMRNVAKEYPGYGFESHVGYGTKQHQDGLKRAGLCPLHRRNFAPIREMISP